MRISLLQVLISCLVFFIVFTGELSAQSVGNFTHSPFPGDQKREFWVDSVYNALNREQRIAQLLMIRANSVTDSLEIRKIAQWIRKYNLGGICFFKGGPVRQAILTNYYQSLATTPVMISMDAEWGLGMRLDSTVSFARQMTLGAIPDDSMLEKYGEEIAAHLRRLGVQVSFSPVADINNNPANPVINVRSFGENKDLVARKAIHYMHGLQKGGVMSVAKHFPGHGDTDTDSHLALPVIEHSRETIDSLDLYPFRKLIEAGVDGVMVAHLFIPALDTSRNLPSSLSPAIINHLLKEELRFSGLVFTDALDMKGAAGFAPPGELEVRALLAGNDVLLLPESVDSAVLHISMALDSGLISGELLEDKCKRVLRQKYQLSLTKPQKVELNNLVADLNSTSSIAFNQSLYNDAVTLLKNDNGLLPLALPDTLKIAAITIGYRDETVFSRRLSSYANIDHFYLHKDVALSEALQLLPKLQPYNLLLLTVNNTHPSPARMFGFSATTIKMVDTLLRMKAGILTLFALPYSVELFRNANQARAIIVGYQDNAYAYETAAQLIFGGASSKGRSPVSVSPTYPLGSGVATAPPGRLGFGFPEELGISSDDLGKIDTIVNEGLREKAFPGCQVLVAKRGKVIYSRAFGFHDYSKQRSVKETDLYDLASITKVAATTLAVMKLKDEGLIDVKKPLSRYLPSLEKSNKSKITVREVMAHQAGLIAWIPFFRKTLLNNHPDTTLYKTQPDSIYAIKVAEGLYLDRHYPVLMLDSIIQSPVSQKKEYKYSDLGFILMQKAVERLSGSRLDTFVTSVFYRPMGLPALGYLPEARFPKSAIVPTENDTIFRRQLVHGQVHDPAAAMMGGVAGHAGLFGNATDLAAIFQMLLQHGTYGGRHYIDSATVAEFTAKQFPHNRRGLGFDKPQPQGEEGPACPDASANSFGHTGFTGTYVWADPDEELIIVFLSNRVNPNAEDNKLVKLGIRTRIQQVVYDAIKKAKN